MGNICRSPSAEGFFRHHLEQSPLAGRVGVDSCGTHSYHIGNSPDHRAIRAADRFGVDLSGLRARKIGPGDFHEFDLIVAMDRDNLSNLERLAPATTRANLALMMDYAPREGPGDVPTEVPDPYYGSQHDFEYMCELLDQATRGLLRRLEEDGV